MYLSNKSNSIKGINTIRMISIVQIFFTQFYLYPNEFFQVFRQIELPAELARLERLRTKLRTQRYRFLDTISNNTDVTNLRTLASIRNFLLLIRLQSYARVRMCIYVYCNIYNI